MDTIQIGRPNAQPWREHSPPDASDIVVQVTDILFEYLPPTAAFLQNSPSSGCRR